MNGTELEEEFWSAPPLLTGHKIHTIRLGGRSRDNAHHVLRYKSMSGKAMTPLDMNFGDAGDSDEFYDGTGNLLWMAAVCFSHMVAQRVDRLLPYLPLANGLKTKDTTQGGQLKQNRHRICELGCGTGGAGISLLLCCSNHVGEAKLSGTNDSPCHLVFTDNDAESLDLCRSNCELNNLSSKDYSHELLWWGVDQNPNNAESPSTPRVLEQNSFDTVLATDVVYDLKMIAPLMQTVQYLLKPSIKRRRSLEVNDSDVVVSEGDHELGGHLILSHVPRFCIPKYTADGDAQPNDCGSTTTRSTSGNCIDNTDDPNRSYMELEAFIQSEAKKVGLTLVEIIRPHQVLSEDDLLIAGSENDFDNDSIQELTLENMKEAHAVVFVFQKT